MGAQKLEKVFSTLLTNLFSWPHILGLESDDVIGERRHKEGRHASKDCYVKI